MILLWFLLHRVSETTPCVAFVLTRILNARIPPIPLVSVWVRDALDDLVSLSSIPALIFS